MHTLFKCRPGQEVNVLKGLGSDRSLVSIWHLIPDLMNCILEGSACIVFGGDPAASTPWHVPSSGVPVEFHEPVELMQKLETGKEMSRHLCYIGNIFLSL